MTISLKHNFQSAVSDEGDTSLVRPSNWNAEHDLTLATGKLVGRTTAGEGSAEEISVGTGLSLSAGTLSATGGGAIDDLFWENDQTVTADYTITTGKNAGTFGPITIDPGVTVTVPSGSTWTVV